jgi:histidinol-phosphate phosphatase family protein
MFQDQRARRPALILDRDGTLIENRHYNADPSTIEFLPGAVDLIKRAKSAGFAVLIVSNQSGVARGLFSYEDAVRMNAGLVEKLDAVGASVDASLFCPHHPTDGPPSDFLRACLCRKPAGGMVLDAAQSLSLDLGRLVVIGDSLDDMGLALVLGSSGILVRTGHGPKSEQELRNQKPRADITIVDSLVDVIEQLAL